MKLVVNRPFRKTVVKDKSIQTINLSRLNKISMITKVKFLKYILALMKKF